MSEKRLPSSSRATIVSDPLAFRRSDDTRLYIIILCISLSLTPLFMWVGTSRSFSLILGIVAALIGVILVIRWPIVGFFVILGCVTLVEQNPLTFVTLLTDRLPIFYWPPSSSGLFERPIGFLILIIFLMVFFRTLIKRKPILLGGKLLLPFLFFLLSVAGGVIYGLASGGDLKIIVLEVRPFWYMFLSYLLAYNLMTHKRQIRLFFWIVILDAGFKGIQGTVIYLVVFHTHLQGHREIMSHEESFFFIAFLLLIILFCLYHKYRPQLYTALIMMPFVVIATLANQRRADYLALAAGIIVAWTLIFIMKPQVRKALAIGMFAGTVLCVGYALAFSNAQGVLAEPARGIMSIINPSAADAADASSNQYRINENFDLKYTVSLYPLGMGFGREFLQPIPLADLSSGDPTNGGNPYQFIPHNTMYWVWMRLGPIGYFLLWYLFGAIIIRGCLIARQLQDKYLQVVAIYIVAVVFMEIFVAYADYQLYFYRNVIYIGLLFGILMKLPTLDQSEESVVHESARSVSKPTISLVGSQHS